MASTKSKFKLKQRQKDRKPKKQSRDNDSTDMEDSGVHLEDSSTSVRSWDDVTGKPPTDPSTHHHTHQMNVQPEVNPSRDLPASCHVTTGSVIKTGPRSPQIKITPSPDTEEPSLYPKSCDFLRQHPGSAPISPVHDPGGKTLFTLGPSEDSGDDSAPSGSVRQRGFDTGLFRKFTKPERKSSAGPLAPSGSSKTRFKKISQPLKRSHSAGSHADVPAHALFLRHELSARGPSRVTPDRRSTDTGRGSMDRASSDSDSDDVTTTTTTSKAKTKSGKRSLAKDMKEKLSFLRRRNTDSTISGKDAKPPKPTSETVLNWSKSFENLLTDKYGLELFRDFLQSEFSEENLEFWIACDDYKNLKSNKLNAQAQKIYTDFVAIQAPREINLSSKTREATAELARNPDRHTFETAQRRIQALMETDSYPRFLQSQVYQDLLGDQRANFKFNFT